MTIEEDPSSSKRRCRSSMMSPKSSMCDSMKKPKKFVKKSSIDAETGRQGVPYDAEVHEPITVEMDELFASTKRS